MIDLTELRVTKNRVVRFIGSPDMRDRSPLYAINYFNTRLDILYTLYTYLAGYKALRLGAQVLFKGSEYGTLVGSPDNSRRWLLIVRYPSLETFKRLLSSTYFKIVSILRINAVKDFNFGFTQKNGGPKYIRRKAGRGSKKDRFYAVHHFTFLQDDQMNWPDIMEVFSKGSDIRYFFSGQKVISIAYVNKQSKDKIVPLLMDGLVIWEGLSEDIITSQLQCAEYKSICSSFDTNYIGLLKREL